MMRRGALGRARVPEDRGASPIRRPVLGRDVLIGAGFFALPALGAVLARAFAARDK